MSKKIQRGFTLIELLIVVIILGILAAAVIPLFGEQSKKARISTMKNNLTTIRASLALYRTEHESMPPGVRKDATGLVVIGAAGGTATVAAYDSIAYRTVGATVPTWTNFTVAAKAATGSGNLLDHLLDVSDKLGETRGGTAPVQSLQYGPYMRAVPQNPFGVGPANTWNAIKVVSPTNWAAAVTGAPTDNTCGWLYNPYTLEFVATGSTEMPAEDVEAGLTNLQSL